MLIEGVEAGDDNAISVARRLVAHYPDAAPRRTQLSGRVCLKICVSGGVQI
jgi:hypothetical protein